jgi:type II secretory pathway pseudopilin PulG
MAMPPIGALEILVVLVVVGLIGAGVVLALTGNRKSKQ